MANVSSISEVWVVLPTFIVLIERLKFSIPVKAKILIAITFIWGLEKHQILQESKCKSQGKTTNNLKEDHICHATPGQPLMSSIPFLAGAFNHCLRFQERQ